MATLGDAKIAKIMKSPSVNSLSLIPHISVYRIFPSSPDVSSSINSFCDVAKIPTWHARVCVDWETSAESCSGSMCTRLC